MSNATNETLNAHLHGMISVGYSLPSKAHVGKKLLLCSMGHAQTDVVHNSHLVLLEVAVADDD